MNTPKVFTNKFVSILSTIIDINNTSSFSDYFQDRYSRQQSPTYYTLHTLFHSALQNSEQKYAQYPTDDRRVKSICASVFVEKQWMMTDIKVASINDKLYVIGGRHRIRALMSAFNQLAKSLAKTSSVEPTPEQVEVVFEELLQQDVRVNLLVLTDEDRLLDLIIDDNKSRTMRLSELSHLSSQVLGADDVTPSSASTAAITSDISPTVRKDITAQFFARKQHPKLQTDTRWQIGRHIGHFVMYGSQSAVNKSTQFLFKTPDDFNQLLEASWDILLEVVADKQVIARNAKQIAAEVVAQLKTTQLYKDVMFSIGVSFLPETPPIVETPETAEVIVVPTQRKPPTKRATTNKRVTRTTKTPRK
jgi:hypothetical protein